MAAALLVAGCAEAGPVDGGASAPPGSATTSEPAPTSDGSTGSPDGAVLPTNIEPIAPGGPAQVGPAQIDARAIPGDHPERMTVDLAGTALTLVGTEGSCSTVTAELLAQDVTSVPAQLVVTTTSDGTCTAIAKLVPLSVRLARPLADRTVVLTEVER